MNVFSILCDVFCQKRGHLQLKQLWRERRHTKNDQILTLHIFLSSFFTKKLSRSLLMVFTILRFSKAYCYCASSNTITHIISYDRMKKASPTPSGLMNYLQPV